jgi:hypothetical protein
VKYTYAGRPAERVRRAIRRPEISLDLDDPPGDPPPADHVHQLLAEEPARGRDRIAVEGEEAPRGHRAGS